MPEAPVQLVSRMAPTPLLAGRIGRWAAAAVRAAAEPTPAVPACAGPRAASSGSIGG
ncbi:MAG TPA: hypothetical protein VGO74_08150 [Modestobacter sp.]|nr:hypothetical protein [Modestobacter sp.]